MQDVNAMSGINFGQPERLHSQQAFNFRTDERKQQSNRQNLSGPSTNSHSREQSHTARESAHQLGADIVNLFNSSRSTAPSAAPSRTASRKPSYEGLIMADTETKDKNASGEGLRTSRATNKTDLQMFKDSKQATERTLLAGHQELSDFALSSSRLVDGGIHRVREEMDNSAELLNSFRQLAQRSKELSLDLTEDLIPSAITQHERQLSNLRATYDALETDRIGNLEKRLGDSRRRVEVLKERMNKVRHDVKDLESKDEIELQRSRKRHALFWTMISVIITMIAFFLLSQTEKDRRLSFGETSIFGTTKSDLSDLARLDKEEWSRLKRPPESLNSDKAQLEILDEL